MSGSNYETFVTIYSCVIGGLLTLGGVAWTINKNKEDTEKLRKDTIKPFFYGTPYYKGPNGDKKTINEKKFGDSKQGIFFNIGMILNSDKIEFMLNKIIIGDKEYNCFDDCYIGKSELFELYICDDNYENVKEKPTNIILVINDVDGNELFYEIKLIQQKYSYLPEKIKLIDIK